MAIPRRPQSITTTTIAPRDPNAPPRITTTTTSFPTTIPPYTTTTLVPTADITNPPHQFTTTIPGRTKPPPNPPTSVDVIKFNVEILIEDHVTIPITSILTSIIRTSFGEQFDTYYDNLRKGKTLLNLGDDKQFSIVNWKSGVSDKIILKLKEGLPTFVRINSDVLISREILNTVLDTIKFLPVDPILIPQLRPSRSTKSIIGKSRKVTATLNDLIPHIGGGTGSLSVSSSYKNFVTNQILENYYNTNNKHIDINVDYSDFGNFVTFGSAQKRIDVFSAKLESIQKLVRDAPIFIENLNISASAVDAGVYTTIFGILNIDSNGSASLSQSGSSQVFDLLASGSVGASSSIDYINSSINTSIQIQEFIRTFDGYERSLWFKSNLPYSSSDEIYQNPTTEQYKSDYTYPKILGLPLATSTGQFTTWYSDMSEIATNYDEYNVNKLRDNVPSFLTDDTNSADFLVFTDLIGHHFDNVKVYIKNLEHLSSRYPKVNEEISGDMAKRVLESFGVNAPSIASIEGLLRYVTGDNVSTVSSKDIADEYYKRYVHALPFLLKTKGTKQSITSLLNVFGINPDLLTVKESISNRYTTLEPSKVTTTEQNFTLNINSGSYLIVPFSSSLRSPQTVQLAFSLLDDRTQTVLKFDNDYSLDAVFHPSGSSNTYYSNFGRIDLVSGSTSLVTSSYFDLFDENFVSVQLKYNNSGVELNIRKVENGDLTFSQSLQEPTSMSADWGSLVELYIGTPAVSSSTGYTSASLDEFRLWGEQISNGKFIEFAENPGMYAGNSYTSSLESLFVRLSFNLPSDLATDGYVINTTPYISRSALTDLTNISGSGFSTGVSPYYQTVRNIRVINQSTYDISANSQATDMIRIAPAPPTTMSLSSTDVTVSLYDKFNSSSVGSYELDISISPVDTIDREIVRAFGGVNLGDYIGRPIDRTADRYVLLDEVEDTFVKQLAPTVEYNNFIRFFDKFLHLFYESVDQYLPARARIRKGIVIRSSVLNRTKVNNRTNIKFSGETSRRTKNALSGSDSDVVRSDDVVLSLAPSPEDLSTQLFGIFSNQDSSYQVPSFGSTIKTLPEVPLLSWYDTYTGSMNVYQTVNPVVSSLDHGYDVSGLDSLYATLTRPYQETGLISVEIYSGYGTSSIGPVSDLFTFSRYGNVEQGSTYFNSPYGLYYVDTTQYTPVTQSWMSPAPSVTTWVNGTSYSFGDVVLQPFGTLDTNGDEFSGNGNYYVLKAQGTSQNSQVVSSNVPQLDTTKWTKLSTQRDVYQSLVRVVYTSLETSPITGDIGPIINTGWTSDSFDTWPGFGQAFYILEPTLLNDISLRLMRSSSASGSATCSIYEPVFGGTPFTTFIPDQSNKISSIYFDLNTIPSAPSPSSVWPESSVMDFSGENIKLNSGSYVFMIEWPDATPANTIHILMSSSAYYQLGTEDLWTPVRSGVTPPTASYQNGLQDLNDLYFEINGHSPGDELTILTDLTTQYMSVPIEYTRKHFRFFRENSIGARRRTYLGTQNTSDTSIDKGPPFEVFDININVIQVSPPVPCD